MQNEGCRMQITVKYFFTYQLKDSVLSKLEFIHHFM